MPNYSADRAALFIAGPMVLQDAIYDLPECISLLALVLYLD